MGTEANKLVDEALEKEKRGGIGNPKSCKSDVGNGDTVGREKENKENASTSASSFKPSVKPLTEGTSVGDSRSFGFRFCLEGDSEKEGDSGGSGLQKTCGGEDKSTDVEDRRFSWGCRF